MPTIFMQKKDKFLAVNNTTKLYSLDLIVLRKVIVIVIARCKPAANGCLRIFA